MQDPTKKKIYTCQVCKKEFVEWVYRNRVACSRTCASKMSIGCPKPTRQKPEIHITKDCLQCGKEYKTTTHHVRLRGSNFCSKDCMYEHSSANRRGIDNPNWSGGHIDNYGPNWHRQKRKAIKRDKSTCQVCGYKSGGDIILDVHHITPAKTFTDFELANNLSNLITLCRICHMKVEKGKIPCPILLGA